MAKAKQLEFDKVNGWGGARRGAGRPNLSKRVNHMKRDRVRAAYPLHITMRLKELPVSLRSKRVLQAFNRSAARASERDLKIIHFALLRNHLHMIVETDDNATLARGMKSFAGNLGRFIRKLVGGTGSVFHGRYHVHILRTPNEMKKALRYVLLNFAKHTKAQPHVDSFSSAPFFATWFELIGLRLGRARRSPYPSFTSWLGRVGWMRA